MFKSMKELLREYKEELNEAYEKISSLENEYKKSKANAETYYRRYKDELATRVALEHELKKYKRKAELCAISQKGGWI
jgi:flagellar motor switch protein FliM